MGIPACSSHSSCLLVPRSLGAVSEVAAAGVIGTGTHNTGIKHGILPTQVRHSHDQAVAAWAACAGFAISASS